VLEGAVRSGLAATAILEKELSLSGYAR
jgi:hypothetical protein